MDEVQGWKEIAGHIGKGVRQAQRWEKLGMPVHRVAGMDGVVFAYRSEIDRWRLSGAGPRAEGAAPGPEARETAIAEAGAASFPRTHAADLRVMLHGALGHIAIITCGLL